MNDFAERVNGLSARIAKVAETLNKVWSDEARQAAAEARRLSVKARASSYDSAKGTWDIQERRYNYGGANRKAAINYGLKRIQREFPNHKEHEAAIED